MKKILSIVALLATAVLGFGQRAVSYNPNTGALTAPTPSILRPALQLGYINVKDSPYLATGDGVADDTAEIQAAIDALVNGSSAFDVDSTGGTIFLPPGIFRLTSALSVGINDYGVRLVGAGRDATILYVDHVGVGVHVLGTNSGAGFTRDFSIEGVSIRSSHVALTDDGSAALRLQYTGNWTIRDCWFATRQARGIDNIDSLYGIIDNCRIGPLTGNLGPFTGIYLDRVGVLGAPNAIVISNCTIQDCLSQGIFVNKGERVTIRNCWIESNEQNGVVFDMCNSLLIAENYFESNGQANVADSADIKDRGTTGLSANVQLIGNHFSGESAAHTGTFRVIDLVDSRGFSVERNDLRGGTSQIIRIGTACSSGWIAHNRAVVDPTIDITTNSIGHRSTDNWLRISGDRWTQIADSERSLDNDIAYAYAAGSFVTGDTYTILTVGSTDFTAIGASANTIGIVFTATGAGSGSGTASIRPNLARGRHVRIGALTGNVAIALPINAKDGDEIQFEFLQDATGGHTVTWPTSGFKVSGVVNSAGNARTVFVFHYEESTQFFVEQATSIMVPPSLTLSGNLSSPAWGVEGVRFNSKAGTFTDTSSSGTVALAATNTFGVPTLAASSATTFTQPATVRIAGPPVAGTNVTITQPVSLSVSSGNSGFFTAFPTSVVHIQSIDNAAPGTSGSAANGGVRLVANGAATGLDMGGVAGSYMWLQARSTTNYASNYGLYLQPNGGGVTTPIIYKTVSVHGAAGATESFSGVVSEEHTATLDTALTITLTWPAVTSPVTRAHIGIDFTQDAVTPRVVTPPASVVPSTIAVDPALGITTRWDLFSADGGVTVQGYSTYNPNPTAVTMTVDTEVYGAGWNADLTVPTKDAVYDKIETLGGAPTTATYITQTADGTLSNEQAMGALATGIVKNTTTTGVQSIAVAGTDYAGLASANTFTAPQTNSTAGATSAPAMVMSGAPFAGTGTTSFPLFYINQTGATASTTLDADGTFFGINADASTPTLMDLMQDGGSKFSVSGAGAIIAASSITSTGASINSGNSFTAPSAGKYEWTSRSEISTPADGKIKFAKDGAATGVTFDFVTADTFKLRNLADGADGTLTAGAGTFSGQLIGVGTATNNDAAAGVIGQIITSTVAVGSAVSLTTTVAANVTSISLTAGDWDVEGNVNFTGAAATVTAMSGGITSTSATVPTDGTEVYSGVQTTVLSFTDTATAPRKRFSLAGTTTVYLVASSTFTVGTVGGFGAITARRVR